jgi:hypothetical protein
MYKEESSSLRKYITSRKQFPLTLNPKIYENMKLLVGGVEFLSSELPQQRFWSSYVLQGSRVILAESLELGITQWPFLEDDV